MAKEGNYFRVLETHKRRLGDYEQMHFRKSMVVQPAERQISLAPRRSSRPQLVSFDKNTAAMYLRQTENIWLAPTMSRQDSSKVLFNKPIGSFVVRNSQKARYALSLRIPNQEESDPAVKHFLIQTNQQGFLTIQGSNLPFLSIYDLLAYFCFNQSGGMPCCLRAPISMETGDSESSDSDEEQDEDEVCLLSEAEMFRDTCSLDEPPPPTFHPPTRRARANAASIHVASSPKQGAHLVQKLQHGPVLDNFPTHEVIFIDRDRQDTYVKTQKEQKASKQATSQKRTPPPKPPRNFPLEDDYCPVPPKGSSHTLGHEYRGRVQSSSQMDKNVPERGVGGDTSSDGQIVFRRPDNDITRRTAILNNLQDRTGVVRRNRTTSDVQDSKPQSNRINQAISGNTEEMLQLIRRVDSIVDMDACKVYAAASKPPPVMPKPHRSRFPNQPPSLGRDIPPPRLLNRHSRSNEELQGSRPRANSTKVTSLIQMFEAKSPTNSPTHSRRRFAPPHRRDGVKHPSPDRGEDSTATAPVPPPKPRSVQPPVPPKPSGAGPSFPEVPPRTPAPLLPPKPPGSKPPNIVPRRNRVEKRLPPLPFVETEEEVPPSLPVKRRHHYEEREGRGSGEEAAQPAPGSHYESVEFSPEPAPGGGGGGRGSRAEELTELSTTSSQLPGNQEVASSKFKWKPNWTKKLPFQRKPRKRIRKFILELAADTTQEFGHKISEFIIDMRSPSQEPHQKMLSEIRSFITTMHDYLVQHHRSALLSCGMEACNNFEHVVETTLQQCILQPLSHYVYLRIEEYYSQNGFLFQVQRSVHQGKLKSPEDMGIRKQLVVPGEKVVAELTEVFQRMMKTYCAISKLEYLLEAVRLTYENVKDAKNPKKSMHDLGADDFLPLFVWVLVQCGFHRAEIEAEYMWGLAHPSLFNGEGGYYLTTLTSAVNVLKELTQRPEPTPDSMCQQLPTMNNLQTELKVFFEDENTGQYSSAYYLPTVPNMTVQEICEIIAERHQIASPEEYTLFSVINGVASAMADADRPQERKLQWTLERTAKLSTAASSATALPHPTNSFIAYKRKHPDTYIAG